MQFVSCQYQMSEMLNTKEKHKHGNAKYEKVMNQQIKSNKKRINYKQKSNKK